MTAEVEYGNTILSFIIERSERKTLAIEVHPDLSIKVIAPLDAAVDDVKEKILKRASWISKQTRFFEQFLPRTPEREYVAGESHLYLGRKYLLRIKSSTTNSVKLKGGEFLVSSIEKENKELIKNLLCGWYYKHSEKKFKECVSEALSKFKSNHLPNDPPVILKRMRKRWGSCTPKGNIILNPELIKAPKKCIEYVVIHELCHFIHPNHSSQFYDLLSQIMPDWKKWKDRLEKSLV